MYAARVLFVCILTAGLCVACDNDKASDPSGVGIGCSSDADCPGDLICYQQHCVFVDYPSDGDLPPDGDNPLPDGDQPQPDALCVAYCEKMMFCGVDLGPYCVEACGQGVFAGGDDYLTCVVEGDCGDIGFCASADADGDLDEVVRCRPGDTMCAGHMQYNCVNNDWEAGIYCPDIGMVCKDDACEPPDEDGDMDIPDSPGDEQDTVICIDGTKKCVGNMVYACAANTWAYYEDCHAYGDVCNQGYCVADTPEGLCPRGQSCEAIIETGLMGCLEGNNLPADSQTGCNESNPCTQNGGNATCHCQDTACNETICTSNCGVCPAGQICVDITGTGIKGCVVGQQLPEDSQTGCNEDNPCTQNGGNASCYCRNETCSETVCVNNCS